MIEYVKAIELLLSHCQTEPPIVCFSTLAQLPHWEVDENLSNRQPKKLLSLTDLPLRLTYADLLSSFQIQIKPEPTIIKNVGEENHVLKHCKNYDPCVCKKPTRSCLIRKLLSRVTVILTGGLFPAVRLIWHVGDAWNFVLNGNCYSGRFRKSP